MRCKWTIIACTLVTSATFFVAAHPALIRNIICQRYLFRRSRLVELWYSALLNELNSLNFNEQTPEWRLHGEAVRKLESARQSFLTTLTNSPYLQNQKSNIRSAFENYKNECSEILAVIRNLSDIKKQNMKILPTVQEVYARHQIYVIREPLVSDVFRFKFREFIQCLDAFKAEISDSDSSPHTVQDLKEAYESKFTDLKEKIQEDLRICIQRYGIGTPAYRRQICELGDTYKREMDRLIAEFRSKCSDVMAEIRKKNENARALDRTKVPTSVELDAELKKLLEDYWESDVIPLLRKFHYYLEQTLCLTLQTSNYNGGNDVTRKVVFEVLHALQTAKRRFGDALWHARRESKRHLAETYQHTSAGSPEYSEAIADILDEWRESMAPHLKRFNEEIRDIDAEIGKLYERKKIPRERMSDDEVKLGDVRVGKIFDTIVSSLIVDYDSCIEDLSELSDEADTPEGKFKAEALLKLKNIRGKLKKKVSELKKELHSEMAKEKYSPENLGELLEQYREKLSPVEKEFETEIRKIDSEIENFRRKSTRSASPWRLNGEDCASKILTNITKILNIHSDENFVAEPYLDDLYRHFYRSSVMDFNGISNQLLEFEVDSARGEIDKDILASFKNCLSEFGLQLRAAKRKTAEALRNLRNQIDQNSQEYEKQIKLLSDKTHQDLKSLREVLNSKLDTIRKTLGDKHSRSSTTRPKHVDKKSFKMRNDLDRLFRDYWKTNVLPLLQMYHQSLEDIIFLLDRKEEQVKNIHEIIHSLKLAKRKYGDVLWNARVHALNILNVACKKPGVQPQDYTSEAAHIFEDFKRNIELDLNRFKNELGGINQVFNKTHDHMNHNQPATSPKTQTHSSNSDDSRFTEIFDIPLSTLILEYDSYLEELCKPQVKATRNRGDILKRLKKTRDAFHDAITAVTKKGEDKLKESTLEPNEIQDLIAQLKNDLSKQMNTFNIDLSKINNDMTQLRGDTIPSYQKEIKKNWSPWQLPSALKLEMPIDDHNSIREKVKGKNQNTIQSKNLSSPAKNFTKRGNFIQEPAIHDCFQGKYWQIIDDIESIICGIEDLDFKKSSPLYETKKDILNRLDSLQGNFKKEHTAMRKEANNQISALGENYAYGSSDYRKKLPEVVEKYKGRLRKVRETLRSKLAKINELAKEKFPNSTQPLMKEMDQESQNGSWPELDEELISLLSDYWRKHLLPRMCDYLSYLEEINALNFENSVPENERIYKLLRALQIAKRLFGDELMSQRHHAQRNLKTARQKFGKNSPRYADALKELKETWVKDLAPHMKKFEGNLSAIGGQLETIRAKTSQKRMKPLVEKKLEIDDIRLCKMFDDSVLIFMIDFDAILENISDLPIDKNSSQSQIKNDALQSLKQTKEKFWENYNHIKDELNDNYSQNVGEKKLPEKIYDDYSSKLANLTTASKSNLSNIKALLDRLKEKGNIATQESYSKPWYPPASTKLTQKSTEKNKPERYTNKNVNADNTQKREVLTKKGNISGKSEHNSPAILKSAESAEKEMSNLPILPEPILDDIFRYSYRENVEYIDSFLSDLEEIKCQPSTPEYETIQSALKKLRALIIDLRNKFTGLKKSAATDLNKILDDCNFGSPEYWNEVSVLLEKYKRQLEIYENALKGQIDDAVKSTGKDIRGNTKKPKTFNQLVSVNTELTEFLNAILSSLVSPQLHRLHGLQEEILRLMLEQKVNKKDLLNGLLMELLQEKRRISDILWQDIHDFVNGPGRIGNNLQRNQDEYTHTYADSLKTLRQKISQLVTQFKDKISRFDEQISEFSNRNNVERKQNPQKGGPTANYDNGQAYFKDNEYFEGAIFVFVLECDGRLESLGVIIFGSKAEDVSAKVEIIEKLQLYRKNFMEMLQRLKSELYDLLHLQNNDTSKDEIKMDYKSKLNTFLDKLKTDMNGIDSLIETQRKKLGIPKNLSSSSKSLIPWHSAIDFGVNKKHPGQSMKTFHKKPTSQATENKIPAGKSIGDSKRAKEKVQPKNLPSTQKSRSGKEVDIQEPFIHDAFQDDYRIVITSYDKIIKLLKKLDHQTEKDLLKQLETALTDYKQNYHNLREKTAAELNKICESLEADSQEYRTKISSFLKDIKQKLKIIHENFDTKRNETRQLVSSRQPKTAHQAVSTRGQPSDTDSKLESLLSEYWRTEVLPRLLRFHRCLEGINNLIVKLNSADQKEIYKLLRSLQVTKRKFGDILWHARRDFTEEVERALKNVPIEKYSNTFDEIKTSWRKKLQPQLSKFSSALDKTDESLNDLYGRHNLEKIKFTGNEIFHFDDARIGKPFYDAIFIIIIEYDCRLDDLSKLVLDLSSTEGRSKSDAFEKLLKAWSDLFSSILKIKEELIAEVHAAEDSNAIAELLQRLRSKLEGPMAAFRTLLGKVDSVLESLAAKLGLCFRQYSTTVSLSPWRIRIETDEQETDVAGIVKSVANTLL